MPLIDVVTARKTGEGPWKEIRNLASAVFHAVGGEAALSVFLLVSLSLSEGAGLALLLPALQLAGFDLFHLGVGPHYLERVLGFLSQFGFSGKVPLLVLLAAFAMIIIVRSALARQQRIHVLKTVYEFVRQMDVNLYQSILAADWLTIARTRSSDLIHLLTSDHDGLLFTTEYMFAFLADLASIAVYSVAAFLLSPAVTLMLAIAGALLVLTLRKKTIAVHETSLLASQEARNLSAEALGHLQNLKAIKTYSAEGRDLKMYAELNRRSLDRFMESVRSGATANFWFESGFLLIVIAMVYVTLGFHLSSAAGVLVVLAISSRLIPKVTSAFNTANEILKYIPAYTKYRETMRTFAASAEPLPELPPAPSITERIRFEGVSFRFSRESRLILDSISIEIPAHKLTAIAGLSGAGKSTIADLAMGVLVPSEGSIAVDGVKLTPPLARALGTRVGYVAPQTVLFHDTVRTNLLWAKPDASEQEMREALELSAADFVLTFEKGLDTVVGDRGMLLSSGELQRIALARALLRKPSLLILDEATNNLDGETEARVMNAIVRLKNEMTVLMIAHRIHTLRFADQIIVVEGGKVVERGNWNSLIEESGRFRELYHAQNWMSAK